MRIRHLVLTVALATASFAAASELHATPNALTPRANFTNVVTIGAIMLGDCGPNGRRELNDGVDDVGPFFSFESNTSVAFTYRPRGASCGACSVRHWGDGGISAVRIFREQFERLKRSTDGVVPNPQNNPPIPPCAYNAALGQGNSCVGSICAQPLTVTPRDVMTGPDGSGLNGAELDMLVDPVTLCFEDYRFRYSVYN